MRILITGSSGKLGSYLLNELRKTPHEVVAWSGNTRGEMLGYSLVPVELEKPDFIEQVFLDSRPDVVIHAAAQSSIAACLNDPELAQQTNVAATEQLANLAGARGTRFLFLSTDMVFDGGGENYREDDTPAPVSTYGRSKLAAEAGVLQHANQMIVRVSLMFGPTLVDRPAFFDDVVRKIQQQADVQLFRDEWRTPLSLAAAARALIAAAESDVEGLFHLGGPERMSRWEMGQQIAARLGVSDHCIHATESATVPAVEPRPRDLSLDSSKWRSSFADFRMPTFAEALAEMGVG